MTIKEIMNLAEAQASARIEQARASLAAIERQMAQLSIDHQAAIDALSAAVAAKARIEVMIDEHLNKSGGKVVGNSCAWSLNDNLITVYAANNKEVGILESWYVVAATTKEDAEEAIKSATKHAAIKNLIVRQADYFNSTLNKVSAQKAVNKPGKVFMLKPNRKTMTEM